MLANRTLVAFVSTTDFSKARAFYGTMLGLPIVSEDAFALVVDANGIMLRISKVDKLIPQRFTVLGWEIRDIAEMVTKMKETGIVFERYDFLEQDAAGIWTAPSGARIAWFKDPDGNVLSISQP